MGVAPSLFRPWGDREKQLKKLQETILDYLASEDYSADPYVNFTEITSLGYSTLEEFIENIPPCETAEAIIYQQILVPVPELGMRFVVQTDPLKRGTLVERIAELPNGKLATLKMDQANSQPSIFTRSVNLFLYIFFPIRLLLNYYTGRMLTNGTQHCSYDFDLLLLEKFHLRAYLQHNNQNNSLPVRPTLNPSISPTIDNDLDLMTSDEDDISPEVCPPIKSANSQKPNGKQISPGHPSSRTDALLEVVETKASSVPSKKRKSRSTAKKKTQKLHENVPIGSHKGIEGAHNSCYMDSTLFAMFYTTSVFDFLLKPKPTDSEYMQKTREILKENIVSPLRRNFYCDYESVWILREHLSPKNKDLMGAFMDAEQVLYLLCEEVLMEPAFIQYAGIDDEGWGDFMHLMSIDASDPSKIITVQQNIKTSFVFNGDIKMATVPSPALILGMPRSNRELIHYEAVIPNTEISLKNLIERAKCNSCGKKATWEIQGQPGDDVHIKPICTRCLSSCKEDNILQNMRVVNRQKMKLRAIICIRGAHFVAFVRTNGESDQNCNNSSSTSTADAWYFFDSMAGGYPEVQIVPDLQKWLDDVANQPDTFYTHNIPNLVKRSLTDGHLCIYEPIMYKI